MGSVPFLIDKVAWLFLIQNCNKFISRVKSHKFVILLNK